MKKYLVLLFSLATSITVHAQDFNFEGFWVCDIGGNPQSSEYILLRSLNESEYVISYCAPYSDDNSGNSHIIDFCSYGYISDEGNLYTETGSQNFTFEPYYDSILEYWNGYQTDRIFSRIPIGLEIFTDIEEYLDKESFHNLIEEIELNKEKYIIQK